MTCPTFYPSGTSECNRLRGRYQGFIFLNKKTELTAAEVATLAAWASVLAKKGDVKGFFVDTGNGYTNNTAEPERNTAVTGGTTKTHDPEPMMVAYMKTSMCDYLNLFNADNQDFMVVPVLPKGNLEVKQKTNGNYAGCRCTLSIRKNTSRPDALHESYPVYIDYKDASELDSVGVVETAFDISDLVDAIPVGLSMRVVTAYTAGVVVVELTKRCSNAAATGYTSATNYEILEQAKGSTDTDIAITPADGGVGRYNLTIKKDSSGTPADITAAVTIRAIDDDGTNYTYLSQPLEITP